MIEQPAKGVCGYLLYDYYKKQHFFRVYNPDNKREYKDYSLHIEDLKITIESPVASLFHDGEKGEINWSSDYLKKPKRD